MSNIFMQELTLNTITGPKVSRPSVSPDTLKRFNHPYHSFLQTYCVKKGNKKWYGQLGNFGMQYVVPVSMILPVEVAELLGLENRDTVQIELAKISAAEVVHYEILGTIDHVGSNFRPLLLGVGLEKGQEYEYEGNHIRIAAIDPERSFYDETTQLEELTKPGQEDEDWGQASEVQTGLVTTKTENAEFEEITEEHK